MYVVPGVDIQISRYRNCAALSLTISPNAQEHHRDVPVFSRPEGRTFDPRERPKVLMLPLVTAAHNQKCVINAFHFPLRQKAIHNSQVS